MAQTVFPCLTFRDAKASIEWLERALGGAVTDPDGNRWSLGTYGGES